MTLTVIGSSSSGNGYVLQNNTEALVIEAGCSYLELQRAVGFDTRKIQGCLISHEHGDHAAYAEKYQEMGIKLFTSNGTFKAISSKRRVFARILENESKYKVGNFSIVPFLVNHDAAEPFGFLIHHPETGVILFATDTASIDAEFFGLNNILIEANYSDDIVYQRILKGSISAKQITRTKATHMSIERCRRMLELTDLTAVNNIVLIHLSDGNSNAESFKKEIIEATGKAVHIADSGMIINFNKTPF